MRFAAKFALLSLTCRFTEASVREISSTSYSSCDDASFAVCSTNLSNMLGDKQRFYDDYMAKCRIASKEEGYNPDVSCDKADSVRRRMNRLQPAGMVNFTKTGFAKVKTPPHVFKLIEGFWNLNRDQATIEWDHHTPYHNAWDSPPTILKIHNESLPTGGGKLQQEISHAARNLMEQWTGMRLSYSSVYGVRVYHNQSVLAPHVDRLPLVSSAIINVAQDVDEDWVLEVFDHDGKAHNVTMEPGDMVLYESHSVVHGRPFPLQGKFYANCFVHFEPLAPLDPNEISDNLDLPPYINPGTEWEREFRKTNPNGWKRFADASDLIAEGDLSNLRRLAQWYPDRLHTPDERAAWQPIHEAARQGRLDIFKFMVENAADLSAQTKAEGGKNAIELVKFFHGEEHPILDYVAQLDLDVEEIEEDL